MAITHGTALRNTLCNEAVDSIDAGGAGSLEIGTTGFASVLATFTFNATAFGVASGGTAAANGLPLSDTSADATGTAAEFRVKSGGGTVVWSGNVTVTAGGGDMTLTSLSITAGEQIDFPTTFTYTAPL